MKMAIAALVVALVACTGPARGFSTYESKAVKTAEAVLSGVETTRAAIELALGNKMHAPGLSVTMAEAEEDASSAQQHFDSIQPPDARSDDLRNKFDQLLTSASSALSDARIAMRRGDASALRGLQPQLAKLSNSLDEFTRVHG